MTQNSQPPDMKKIAALSAGIIVALGAAGWNIMSAMGPPARSVSTRAAPAAEPARSTQPAPAVDPGSGSQGAAARGGRSGSPALAGGETGEEVLALQADPFEPLPEVPKEVPKPAAPAPTRAENPPEARISMRESSRPAPVLPDATGALPAPKTAASPAPADAVPRLIGTLLGERPSAVFQGPRFPLIVPVGGTVGEWRVVSVSHGAAVVRSAVGTRRLVVGSSPPGETVYASEDAPGEKAASDRPEMMASVAPGPGSARPESDPPSATPGQPELPVLPANDVPPVEPPGDHRPEEQ